MRHVTSRHVRCVAARGGRAAVRRAYRYNAVPEPINRSNAAPRLPKWTLVTWTKCKTDFPPPNSPTQKGKYICISSPSHLLANPSLPRYFNRLNESVNILFFTLPTCSIPNFEFESERRRMSGRAKGSKGNLVRGGEGEITLEITLRKRRRRGMEVGAKRAASGSYVSRWLVNVSGGARKRKRDAI